MIFKIFRDYKKNLLSVILLIIGYTMGILSLSIGVSGIIDARNYSLDRTSGDPKSVMLTEVAIDNHNNFSYNNIYRIFNLLSKKIEIQVLNFQTISIGKHKAVSSLIPIINYKKSNWNIPIIYGRYFSEKESFGRRKVVVVGKKTAKNINLKQIDSNSTINIYGDKYKIIGIAGRRNRATQWDDTIYIPFKALPQKLKQNFILHMNGNTFGNEIYNITLLLRDNNKDLHQAKKLLKNAFNKYLKQNNLINYHFEDTQQQTDNSSLVNSIIGTALGGGTILMVALMNVMNISQFWILDRKKEIAIKRAIGATNLIIIITILIEMSLLAIIAGLISIIIQNIIAYVYYHMLFMKDLALDVSIYNLIVAMGISLLCGILSSIIPIKTALKLEPAEAFKAD